MLISRDQNIFVIWLQSKFSIDFIWFTGWPERKTWFSHRVGIFPCSNRPISLLTDGTILYEWVSSAPTSLSLITIWNVNELLLTHYYGYKNMSRWQSSQYSEYITIINNFLCNWRYHRNCFQLCKLYSVDWSTRSSGWYLIYFRFGDNVVRRFVRVMYYHNFVTNLSN